jgi:hypothetical protein
MKAENKHKHVCVTKRKEERLKAEQLARQKAKAEAAEAAEEAERRAAETRREAEEAQRLEGMRAAEKMRARLAADCLAASGDVARSPSTRRRSGRSP